MNILVHPVIHEYSQSPSLWHKLAITNEFLLQPFAPDKECNPSIPGLSHFCFSICVQYIIHGSGRAAKNGEGLRTLSVYHVIWKFGGGGGVLNYKFVCNKSESEFLTGQAE